MAGMQPKDLVKLSEVRIIAASGEARRIRHASRLSSDQIARTVGVSGVTVVRWELGQRSPSGEAALRYFDLLDRLRKVTAP